jgi:hypothetical protein
MTADTDYEIILYRKGTAGTITYAFGDSSLVISGSRNYKKDRNEPATVEFALSNGSNVAAENFLSASFAGWSGGVTGALQLGDYVKYSLYTTKTGAKTQVFYGKVVRLQQTKDGQLQVKAVDYLQVLNRKRRKIVYSGYRDRESKSASWSDGYWTISGISEDDVVVPMAHVSLALDDKGDSLWASGSTSTAKNLVTGAVAQPYVATQDGLLGIEFTLTGLYAYESGTVKVALQADDGTGNPDGTDIISTNITKTGDSSEDYEINWTSSSVPRYILSGRLYWIVLTVTGGTMTGCYCLAGNAVSGYPIPNYLWKSDGVNWAEQTGKALKITVHTVNYTEMEAGSYVFNDSANQIVVMDTLQSPDPTQSFVTPVRGLVSYFYGTVNARTIADDLAALNTSLVSASSANMTATSGTFSTMGKRLIESLQELADQYQPSGAWSGYQLAFGHYESGGVQYLKWGRRQTIADSSYVTFSHGFDTATDDEVRIIDASGLTRRTDLRPPSVTVIGKDADGDPICYTVTDKALSGGFANRMEGFEDALEINDEGIQVMADAWALGDGRLMAFAFDAWEGQIKVSGVYPELIDPDPTSSTFGSGRVITLNYSPLGIVNQKFTVTGVAVSANETMISISNMDLMVLNAQRYYNTKSQRTEAFYAPVGLVDNMYVAVYYDAAVDWNEGYAFMGLADGSGNRLTGLLGVRCTKHSVTALNLNVYHAEFEMDNGYSAPPKGVSQVWMGYIADFESLSSAYLKRYYLYNGSAPIRDERFDKFKTSRLIVDFLTKIA